MPIDHYIILYGAVVPYPKMWNYFHPKNLWIEDEENEEKIEWIHDLCAYRRGDRHADLKKFEALEGSPLLKFKIVDVPHDQAEALAEEEGEENLGYVVVGIVPTTEKPLIRYREFRKKHLEIDRDGQNPDFGCLPKGFLKDMDTFIIQNDCACCT